MIRPALCEEHPPDEKCDSCRTFSSRALRSARPCLTCQWVAAQRCEGSNLFDEIIKIHGPGGKESEHGVVLDLRSLAKLASKLQQLLHLLLDELKQYQFGTVSIMPGKYWASIIEVAADNGGYVTPVLVAPFGVPAIELRKMVARNVLTSAAHGVYRVPSLPVDTYDEFVLARLWAKGRGVVSHDSALLVHELCDINPTKVQITIPRGYRIGKAGAEG
jgi:hypothetical protein